MGTYYNSFNTRNVRYKDSSGTERGVQLCCASFLVTSANLDAANASVSTHFTLGTALRVNAAGTIAFRNTGITKNSVFTFKRTAYKASCSSPSITLIGDGTTKTSTVSDITITELRNISLASTSSAVTINKTHSSQTLTFGVTGYVSDVAGYDYQVNGRNISITVPARPSYTITLNGNGGTSTSATKWYDETLSISGYSSTRTGYDFAGWYTAASGGSKVTSVTANSTATYYAHWTEKTATLTYNNGGHGTAPGNVTMKYTAATNAAAAISATGYNFIGWKRSDNGTVIPAGAQVKAANVIPSALTLTAQWSEKIVTPFIKIDGLWVEGQIRVKTEGHWYECTKGYIKIGDEWKQLN